MTKISTLLLAGILFSTLSYAQVTNGLVACYPFTGNANDMSGNNHNGTVYGATLTTDRFGNSGEAYQFNGTTNYIDIGNFNNFTQSNEFSISVWIQPNQVKPQTILMLQPDNFNDRLNAMAYYSHNGTSATIWDFGNCAAGGRLFQTGMPFSNSWQHFVYCVSPAGGMKIYKNGILVYTSLSQSTVNNRVRSLWIGGGMDDVQAPFYFDGKIDDLRLYDRELTTVEIQNLYGATSLCQPTSLTENTPEHDNYSIFQNNSVLNITLKASAKNTDFQLFENNGKLVINSKNLTGGDSYEISLSGIAEGIYYYSFSTPTARITGKVAIMN